MLFYELFWNLSCTHFMEETSVANDFTGTIVTNLQLVCYFTDSHITVAKNQHANLFSVSFSH